MRSDLVNAGSVLTAALDKAFAVLPAPRRLGKLRPPPLVQCAFRPSVCRQDALLTIPRPPAYYRGALVARQRLVGVGHCAVGVRTMRRLGGVESIGRVQADVADELDPSGVSDGVAPVPTAEPAIALHVR